MEQVLDKLVSELKDFASTPSASGGCSDVMQIAVDNNSELAVYFGDPGILPINSYPALIVEPINDKPVSETTGYEVRNLRITITLLVDARDEFDTPASESKGGRLLVKTSGLLFQWLRRKANRHLDGLQGVREVVVDATDYMVQARGQVIAKSATIALVVEKQYARH